MSNFQVKTTLCPNWTVNESHRLKHTLQQLLEEERIATVTINYDDGSQANWRKSPAVTKEITLTDDQWTELKKFVRFPLTSDTTWNAIAAFKDQL